MQLSKKLVPTLPIDLSARMAQDSARWAPVVKASGFKAD